MKSKTIKKLLFFMLVLAYLLDIYLIVTLNGISPMVKIALCIMGFFGVLVGFIYSIDNK